jgi:aspartate/tyrosine/aromatic aminotransferase
MFELLEPQAPDALLGVMTAFAADTHPDKVDLGVGVYRDAAGITPVMAAVRAAERTMLGQQTSKSYVGAGGNRAFAGFIEGLVLGKHPTLGSGRLVTLQTPGGCGALRLAAEAVKRARPDTRVVVSDPTWPNHVPLIGGAGLEIDRYPYYEPAGGGIRFAAMCEHLDGLSSGTVVVLHASCHNPTGADLSPDQWRQVLAIVERRRLLPLFDLAYQGLGAGLDEDAYAVRLFAERLPELLVAVSCSKNFGLYRERVGAVMALTESARTAGILMVHLQMIARRSYSMPPDHGAAIVATIAGDPALGALWTSELTAMRRRVGALREGLAGALRQATGGGRFDFIAGQRGMFSVLGLPPDAVKALAGTQHIYIAPDSRINVAGLPEPLVGRVAEAIASVL